MSTRDAEPYVAREVGGERGRVPCRHGLEFLSAHIALSAASSQPSSEGDEEPCATPPEELRARAEAWAFLNPENPLVSVVASDLFDRIDLGILRVLVRDRILCDDQALGLTVLDVLRKSGVKSPEDAVADLWRFLPGAPLVAEGLVRVQEEDGVRLLGRNVLATCRLLEAATGIPAAQLEGRNAGRGRAPFDGDASDDGSSRAAAVEASTVGPLVLTPPGREAFDRLVRAVRVRAACRKDLGLDDLLPGGLGVTALFYGPPGTGKTQAARVLARRLERPLHLVGSSDLFVPFLGQSSRNVDQVLAQAETDGAVLCIDEADALVTKRSQAEHTAYRQVTATLLRALERTRGVVVFTTNLAEDLDPALERRLLMRIEFPRPGFEERRRLWEALLPCRLPRADDVDLDRAALEDLSGGEIQNAVVAALTEVADRERPCLTMADVEAGIRTATAGRFVARGGHAMGFAVRPRHAPARRE